MLYASYLLYDVSTFIMVFLIRKLRKPLLKFKALAMEIINQKALGSSATSPSGINTGTITTLPSGLVGKEENIDGKSLFSITEGMAKVFFPASTPEDVFYNPVQEFNRDVSIAVIQQFIQNGGCSSIKPPDGQNGSNGVRILEALSATGLRSIRYAKEISGIKEIIANDISERAVASIDKNVKANNVSDLVTPSHSDATMVMYNNRKKEDRFDVVDLDPYGSPTPFLDGAVQAVAEGGLLCVTCTDLAVLAGNSPETCYTKYGAISLKSKSCHEMALRIVLQCIEAHANRYGRYIVPLLSLSIDFYVRIFVRVYSSQKQCKKTTSKLGNVYQCTGCETINVQPLGVLIPGEDDSKNIKYKLPHGPPVSNRCTYCDHPFQIGGPFWVAPIHDKTFVEEILQNLENINNMTSTDTSDKKFGTFDRMFGMLTVVEEELDDSPFYYNQDRLCSMVKVGTGKMTNFRSALLNSGYQVSLSHASKMALKTNAPNDFIWGMMRAWEKLNPVKKDKLDKCSIPYKILENEKIPTYPNISFELHPDANPPSRLSRMKRFQMNPAPNWGPKMKAHTTSLQMLEKRSKNQGKIQRKRVRKKSSQEGETDLAKRHESHIPE